MRIGDSSRTGSVAWQHRVVLGPADQLLALTILARTRVLPGPEENVGDNPLEYDIPHSGVGRNQAHKLGTALRADPKRIAQLQDLGSA